MGERSATGWRRLFRSPLAIVTTVLVLVLVAGGATAWAVESSGATGYVTGKVVRTSIAQHLVLVGTVEPANQATAAFQVEGQVSSVAVGVGSTVTAGETLASLDPTSLTQALSSAQLSVEAAEATLTEDEESEASSAAKTNTTTTTQPSTGTHTGGGSGDEAQIAQDQATLVADQKAESSDQQKAAADLAAAATACGQSTKPPTAPGPGCDAALTQVSTDQSAVSKDQQKVAADENALAAVLDGTSSTSSSPATETAKIITTAETFPSGGTGTNGSGGTGTGGASADADTPQRIASDEANIFTAQANLIEAQEALSAATLTSPIAGTVVSDSISAGTTVSADSATEDIVIIGTHSFEVAGSLTSSQVTSVKVGFPATVQVDGDSGSVGGTVTQVGPVQSGSSGYSYPVVVDLPASSQGLFTGSTAEMSITTAHADAVLAVPTSAVTTLASRTTVLVMKQGQPARTVVKVGLVGSVYTQIRSGLRQGDTVVLANLATPVPTSSSDTTGGFGGFGGAGGFPGGTANFQFRGGGGAVISVKQAP